MSACLSLIGWLRLTMLLLMLSHVETCKGSRRMSTSTFPEVSVWQGVVSQTLALRDQMVLFMNNRLSSSSQSTSATAVGKHLGSLSTL